MVKQTSIAAYYDVTLDKVTQRGIVAAFIRKKTLQGKPCTRAMIEREAGIRITTVCGRVKELEEEGIILEGKKYRLEYLQSRIKDPITNKTVEAFCLIIDTQNKANNEQ